MIEFYIIVQMYAYQFPDGRAYHHSHPERFKTEQECKAFTRELVNKHPRENQIDGGGTEIKYNDFYCVDIKRAIDGSWASQPKPPPVSAPLPPVRPRGL